MLYMGRRKITLYRAVVISKVLGVGPRNLSPIKGRGKGITYTILICLLFLQIYALYIQPATACATARILWVSLIPMPTIQGANGEVLIDAKMKIGGGAGCGIVVVTADIYNITADLTLPDGLELVATSPSLWTPAESLPMTMSEMAPETVPPDMADMSWMTDYMAPVHYYARLGPTTRQEIPEVVCPPGLGGFIDLYWWVKPSKVGEYVITIEVSTGREGLDDTTRHTASVELVVVDTPSVSYPLVIPKSPTTNDDISIGWVIEGDYGGVTVADLHYSFDGGATWQTKPLNKTQMWVASSESGFVWTAEMPKVLSRSEITYYAVVEDTVGRSITTPKYMCTAVDAAGVDFGLNTLVVMTIIGMIAAIFLVVYFDRLMGTRLQHRVKSKHALRESPVILKSLGAPTFLSSIGSVIAYRKQYGKESEIADRSNWFRYFWIILAIGAVLVVLGIYFDQFRLIVEMLQK